MPSGISSYIASLSMNMAQQSAVQGASIKMLSKTMDSAEAEGSRLIEALNEIPAPSSGVGSLLDVRG